MGRFHIKENSLAEVKQKKTIKKKLWRFHIKLNLFGWDQTDNNTPFKKKKKNVEIPHQIKSLWLRLNRKKIPHLKKNVEIPQLN